MERFAVIMAGGGGTRFWPLSRSSSPKQFLNLSGNDVLINETIDRISKNISKDKIYIVTNINQKEMIEKVLDYEINRENIIYEPVGKNTAACILYAALKIKKKYNDGIMCVFPSDHYIKDNNEFSNIVENCIDIAVNSNSLVTIGIQPTFPSTGYGYIKYAKSEDANKWYEVIEFVEKPTFDKAKEYLKSGNYLWNSGMFIWKVSTIIDCFNRFLPRLYNKLYSVYDFLNTNKEIDEINKVYPTLQDISIDYGIMERSDNVIVVPGDFGWNDVGSWDSLGSIFPPDDDGNIVKALHVGINTRDCIIYGNNRLIASIDLNGIIIAETEDAVLVCPKNRAQDVKKIVEILKEKQLEKYI
ncbi:mannose-1-phosphate guanylyltransferase [Caldicellulosiruptoraceae bacterium PP1]